MAVITLIAVTELSNGQETPPETFTPAGERTSLRFSSQQVGRARSQARVVITDDQGLVKGTIVIDSRKLNVVRQKIIVLENLEGDLTARIECLNGRVLTSLVELDGADGVIPSGSVDASSIDPSSWKTLSAPGVDSSGGDANITVPGAAVGDRVAMAFRIVSSVAPRHVLFDTGPGTVLNRFGNEGSLGFTDFDITSQLVSPLDVPDIAILLAEAECDDFATAVSVSIDFRKNSSSPNFIRFVSQVLVSSGEAGNLNSQLIFQPLDSNKYQHKINFSIRNNGLRATISLLGYVTAAVAGGTFFMDKNTDLDPDVAAANTIVQRQAAGDLTASEIVFLLLPSS